eukprot:Polyplicarium_translucidae@DN2398_c0_g1_i3.p1
MVSTAIDKLKESDVADNQATDALTHVLCFMTSGAGEGEGGWLSVQRRIVCRLLERELFPAFRKEVKSILLRRSERHVLNACQRMLEWRLDVQPFRAPGPGLFEERLSPEDADDDFVAALEPAADLASSDEDEERFSTRKRLPSKRPRRADRSGDIEEMEDAVTYESPKVVSLIVEKLANGHRLHAVAVDRAGQLSADLRLDHLLEKAECKEREKDRAALFEFIARRSNFPNIVIIGASDVRCPDVMQVVVELRSKLRRRVNAYNRRRRYPVVKTAPELFAIHYGCLDVPRVYAAGERCHIDLRRSMPLEAVQALSLARFVQDPMAETLTLWGSHGDNYLMQMSYHRLQHALPEERLQDALLQGAVSSVANVGVDLNRAKSAEHLSAPLAFVPGLGHRKAADLLSRLSGTNVLFRRQLLTEISDGSRRRSGSRTGGGSRAVGEKVFYNCSSFFRIRTLDVEDCVDLLDDTRIHAIESAAIAQKMCRDAQEDEEAEDEDTNVGRLHEDLEDKVALAFKNPDKLDELDLEAYAKILQSKKNQPRMLPYLEFILKEIKRPYADPRAPYESPSAETLLYLFLQESPISLRRGVEVTTRIVESRAHGGVKGVSLPLGLRTSIEDATAFLRDVQQARQTLHAKHMGGAAVDLSAPPSLSSLLPLGRIVSGRIAAIDFIHFQLAVSISEGEIGQILQEFLDLNVLPMSQCSPLVLADLESAASRSVVPIAKSERSRVAKPPRRSVRHPSFRQMPHRQLVNLLSRPDAPNGTAFFRPSEHGETGLLLYVKICSTPFVYKTIPVEELNQKAPGAQLSFATQSMQGSWDGIFASATRSSATWTRLSLTTSIRCAPTSTKYARRRDFASRCLRRPYRRTCWRPRNRQTE